MGKNFFGIEEAIKYFGINPRKQQTKHQIAALTKVPFSEGTLLSLQDTHILVAVFPLSILDIKKMDNKLFYLPKGVWYEDKKFAKKKGRVGWQLIRKTPVEDSMSKNWSEQQALLNEDEYVPSAQVMVYTIIGHYKNTGERLFFKDTYVRTSSVVSDGGHVIVGLSGSWLAVHLYWNDDRFSFLGLASALSPKK